MMQLSHSPVNIEEVEALESLAAELPVKMAGLDGDTSAIEEQWAVLDSDGVRFQCPNKEVHLRLELLYSWPIKVGPVASQPASQPLSTLFDAD